MNYSVTIETPEDNAYGGQRKDGSWTGMIAMLLDNVFDTYILYYVKGTYWILKGIGCGSRNVRSNSSTISCGWFH